MLEKQDEGMPHDLLSIYIGRDWDFYVYKKIRSYFNIHEHLWTCMIGFGNWAVDFVSNIFFNTWNFGSEFFGKQFYPTAPECDRAKDSARAHSRSLRPAPLHSPQPHRVARARGGASRTEQRQSTHRNSPRNARINPGPSRRAKTQRGAESPPPPTPTPTRSPRLAGPPEMEVFYYLVFGALSAVVAGLELGKSGKDRVATPTAFNAFKNNYVLVYSLMMCTAPTSLPPSLLNSISPFLFPNSRPPPRSDLEPTGGRDAAPQCCRPRFLILTTNWWWCCSGGLAAGPLRLLPLQPVRLRQGRHRPPLHRRLRLLHALRHHRRLPRRQAVRVPPSPTFLQNADPQLSFPGP
jgi:hypothetical protein